MNTQSVQGARISTAVLVLLWLCHTAQAGQLGVSQHGARGTAQAGALTAGVTDSSAVTYNPAALVRLEGFQLQLGLSRDAPVDGFLESNIFSGRLPRTYTSNHPRTWLPATYVTYAARRPVRWALGVGVDAPAWFHFDRPGTYFYGVVGLRPDLYVTVRQVHPVVAIAIDDRWSVAGGIRYLWGRVLDEYDMLLDSGRNPGTFFVYGDRSLEATAHGWAGDVSVLFRDSKWGFGAVASTGAALNGIANAEDVHATSLGQGSTPRALANLKYLLNDARRGVGIDQPPELRGGVWLRPARSLRVEGDLALIEWSQADWLRPREYPTCGPSCSTLLPRDWRNTLSLRVGVEGGLGSGVQVQGGFGYEPSPRRFEPYANTLLNPTTVFGVGVSYNLRRVSFDTAYSLQSSRTEEKQGDGGGRYSTRNHIFAVAARLRFQE